MKNKKPGFIVGILFLLFSPVVWLWSLFSDGWNDGNGNGMKNAIKTTLPMWRKFKNGEL